MLTCTRLIPRFFPNAHHHGSLPQQLGVVGDLLLKTDPEGPTLIFHAACPHDWSVHDELLSVRACSTLKPRKSNVSGLLSPPAPAPPPRGGRTGSDGSSPDAGSARTAPTDPAVPL